MASNKINSNSSRSHAIFSVNLEVFDAMGLRKTSSKLTLVDLAGSERMDLIGSSNLKQREESININKSLFNLK